MGFTLFVSRFNITVIFLILLYFLQKSIVSGFWLDTFCVFFICGLI